MRLEIMERDEFACQLCHDDKSTLNVHHHYYEKGKEPWDYPSDALATLCEGCHEYVEKSRLEILKSITWEVPLTNCLRILRHDHFAASNYTNAISNENPIYAMGSAIKCIEEMVDIIRYSNKKIAIQNQPPKPKIEKPKKEDEMSDFDRIIAMAPEEDEL